MTENTNEDNLQEKIEKAVNSGKGSTIARFLLAVVGGAMPFAGGLVSGAGSAWSEHEQDRINKLFEAWFKLQQDEMEEIGRTLYEILVRLDLENPKVRERVESKEYLSLIKKAFRDWSAAESEEKRQLIRNLLANAGGETQITSDDVIRMFIKWIGDYEEPHFKVIRAIYNHTDGITRGGVWDIVHGESVAENSAEADLFKLLFRDLSIGGVVRQHRPTDGRGNFLKQPRRRTMSSSRYMTSAFDDGKYYELTALGNQFVHYTMNEIVPRIASESDTNPKDENML